MALRGIRCALFLRRALDAACLSSRPLRSMVLLLLSTFAIVVTADAGTNTVATDEARLVAREVVMSIAAAETNNAAGGRQVLGAVLIAASPAEVWASWQDWENVSAFVPDLRYYKTLPAWFVRRATRANARR